MTDGTSERRDRYEKALASAVEYVVMEALSLSSLEEFFFPAPAKLAQYSSSPEQLQRDVDQIIEQFGAPPRLIITIDGGPKPKYDVYPAAAMQELVSLFHRCRRATTRAQAFLIGSHLLNSKKEVLEVSDDHIREIALNNIESIFWEHAETGFIRLASFWDRAGQLLDFAFFGIRQFDRDGFSAVMDRIKNNKVTVDYCLSQLPAWASLRVFQNSEKEDGLKWLLRRRNLVVHSLYLRPLHEDGDKELFDSEFNYLDMALRKKLAPGTPAEEITRLNIQLSKAAEMFPNVLELCRHAIDRRRRN